MAFVQPQDIYSQIFTILINRYLDRETVRTCFLVCGELHRIAEKYHDLFYKIETTRYTDQSVNIRQYWRGNLHGLQLRKCFGNYEYGRKWRRRRLKYYTNGILALKAYLHVNDNIELKYPDMSSFIFQGSVQTSNWQDGVLYVKYKSITEIEKRVIFKIKLKIPDEMCQLLYAQSLNPIGCGHQPNHNQHDTGWNAEKNRGKAKNKGYNHPRRNRKNERYAKQHNYYQD